jgi:hypothetical protein
MEKTYRFDKFICQREKSWLKVFTRHSGYLDSRTLAVVPSGGHVDVDHHRLEYVQVVDVGEGFRGSLGLQT